MTPKFIALVVVALLVVAAGFGAGTWYATRVAPSESDVRAGLKPAPTTEPTNGYSLYLVAPDDNGDSGKLIGCGDSLIAVGTQAATVDDALTALFAIKTPSYGQSGLNTALDASTLVVSQVAPGRVDLTGSFMLGGVCDIPRVEEQINATVHQFPGYETATVYVNSKTLKDALSLK